MPKLKAVFAHSLYSHMLAKMNSEEDIVFDIREGDFDTVVKLKQDLSWSHKEKYDTNYLRRIDAISVEVTREETALPPPPGVTDQGGNDWSTQYEYFQERRAIYRQVAVTIINRIIRYFKYKLHQPMLREVTLNEQSLQTPEWLNEDGTLAGKSGYVYVVPPVPGVSPYKIGALYFTNDSLVDLNGSLNETASVSLHEELFSDAQSAAADQNIRRSVLELAISCEVAVKQKFFSSPTPSGAAFEYLEDKGRVNVTVLDLIDNVANQAFGESFKVKHADHYKNIDFIFRCRNKVAHRGIAEYKNDTGSIHQLTLKALDDWIISVKALFSWLSGL